MLGSATFWRILSAVLAILGIAVSVVLWRRGHEQKALAWEAAAIGVVLEELRGQIEIRYEGRPVSDVHLVELVVANVGNVAIRSADYERALTLAFRNNVSILQAQIFNRVPLDLMPELKLNGSKATIAPLLLNPGDGRKILMVVAHYDGDLMLSGRIAGISQFRTHWPILYPLAGFGGVAP